MIFKKRIAGEQLEAGVEEALRNFRSSVHAWSEAEFVRPRTVAVPAHRHAWRRAAVWALGCVLAAGSVSAGFYQHRHQEHLALLAAERAAQQRQMAAEQAAALARQEDEKLMAAVDKDVSQQVPSAMEPLAQLMEESGNQ